MSFNDAIATLPNWVQIWLNILLLGAFIAPASLLIWRASRVPGIIALATSIAGATTIIGLYELMGFVRLIGIGHIFWVFTVPYLWHQSRRADMPVWPSRIMILSATILAISLVFDATDAVRWLLGDRASMLPSE